MTPPLGACTTNLFIVVVSFKNCILPLTNLVNEEGKLSLGYCSRILDKVGSGLPVTNTVFYRHNYDRKRFYMKGLRIRRVEE
jgi:hypothetical protein